jgi:hypothetical protein
MAQPNVPKRLRKIVQQAVDQGWTLDYTKNNHPRLNPPRGQRGADGNLVAPVTFSLTTNSASGDRNSLAALRRSGLKIEDKR